MKELTHWINGRHVKGTSGRFADVMNPATGEVQARVPLATVAELDAAVAEAAKAQVAWGATNPQRRARVMMKFADLINQNMDKLAECVSREHGKVLADGRGVARTLAALTRGGPDRGDGPRGDGPCGGGHHGGGFKH